MLADHGRQVAAAPGKTTKEQLFVPAAKQEPIGRIPPVGIASPVSRPHGQPLSEEQESDRPAQHPSSRKGQPRPQAAVEPLQHEVTPGDTIAGSHSSHTAEEAKTSVQQAARERGTYRDL